MVDLSDFFCKELTCIAAFFMRFDRKGLLDKFQFLREYAFTNGEKVCIINIWKYEWTGLAGSVHVICAFV